jgi:hypothetical protein
MREQWEYKMLTAQGFPARLKDDDGVEYKRFDREMLNRLGKEGWEVCAYNCSSVSRQIVILKRRLAVA